MEQTALANHLINQSKDLVWMISSDFKLVYANKSYLSAMKEITGVEKKLNESVLVEGFGEGYIEKWKTYYNRALKGEYFEIEEHYFNPKANEIQYGQITFEPLTGDDNKIFAVACQSKNITRLVKLRSESNQLMDASLDVFCTIDEKGNFVYVSAGSSAHWGYTPEEMCGKPYVNFILEEDVPKTNEVAYAILAGAEVKSFVNRYKKKDGSIAYNLWSARWDSSAKLMYCVARDGKEKIEQEEKIQQSEQRFKALVQDGSDLITITDFEGNYIYVSPTSTNITGFTPEEFIGRNALEFIHPDDIARALSSLEKLSTQDKVVLEPFRTKNNKNEWRWAETVLTNMLNNPSVKGIVGNTRDITAKIEEEHKLKLLESVITNSNDAILITEAEPQDEPGPRIIYVNEAFTKMTGYTAEEVIGKSPRILQGPNSNKEELAKLSQSLKNWEPCEITTINYKKNGEEFWINFTVTPVADEKGWYTHWIAIERDVTGQKIKELEKELLAQISANFSSENDYVSATKELCKSISKFGKFDWVELWTSNLEKNQMQLFSHYLASPTDKKFYDYITQVDVFKISESLAGRVWAEEKQILWDEKEMFKKFVRSDAAIKIGLKAVLGIPLIFNHQVVGVLKIGTKNDANYLKNYIPIFQRLERFIGSEINRKKLENDLSHLFNAIPDILCLLDLRGRFLKINKAGCDLLGFSEEDILYHRFEEFVHPHDKGIFTNEVMQLVKEETTFTFENRYITKSGEIVWLSWNCNSTLKEGIIYVTGNNITEEKKLRELNSQTLRLAKIGSWEVDLVNQGLFWSDEVHQLHDTDPTSFVPNLESAINFYREDFREIVQASIGKSIAEGVPFDFEAVIVSANKKEIWVRAIGNAEFIDGECKRIYGSFQDIHERKVAEIRLQSLADNLPGVVYQYRIYTDGTDSLKYVTKGSQHVWGFTAEEVVQNNQLVWDRIVLGGEFEKVKKSISDSINTKTKWTSRWKYVMPSGEIKTHLGYGSPNFLADGTILFHSVILDITTEAENEELLEQVTELAKIGSWEINLVQNKTYWSKMVHNIMETDPEHYVPDRETNINFFREDFRSAVIAQLKDCEEKGSTVNFEALVITANKNEKWVRVIGSAEIVDGKTNRIIGSFQDIHDRKEAEEKLVLSEQKYRQLALQLQLQQLHLTNAQEVAKVGSWETELPSLKVTWSDETYRIFGTEKENFEPTHDKFLKYIHPLDRDKVDKAFTDSISDSNQSNNIIEHRIVTASGEVKEVEERWKITYNNKGEPILAIGSCQDITERKVAEELILQSNERFEKVTEATNDAIWDWDMVNQTFYRSNAIERFFGKKALKSFTVTDFWKDNFHPEDLPKIQDSIQEVIANPLINRWELEYRVFNEHKEVLYVIDRGVIIRNKEGKALRMVGAMTDVSEQKKSDEENRFKANLLSRIGQAAIATSLDGVVNYWNKAAENIYGWTEEEAIGKNIIHLTTPDTSKEQAMEIMERLKVGQTWLGEFKVKKKDGTNFPSLITNSPIYDENNMLSGIIGISSDITQEVKNKELLKQYTLELERSNEELEQFAFVASHDLQEPLRMISSFMELLQRKYQDKIDEKGHQYIDFAVDGAKRMKQIILDLLEYSRAGKLTEAKVDVNLNDLLSEFKQLRRKVILEKKATIIAKNLPILNTYPIAIIQILHCLIDNALKYTLPNKAPIIEIKTIETTDDWEFAISDNGIGIEPQFFDKIFIVFQRLHNKTEYEGTGIGLAIAKRHIEFLGGKIWLDSKPNIGTTFCFTIPKKNT